MLGAGRLAFCCPLHSRPHWDCEKVFHYPLPTSPFTSAKSQILATLQQGSHVGWKNNTIFLCTTCIRIKSLVCIGEKPFCSCQPVWPLSLHLQPAISENIKILHVITIPCLLMFKTSQTFSFVSTGVRPICVSWLTTVMKPSMLNLWKLFVLNTTSTFLR